MENLDLDFWIGDILIPIALFIIGLFTGKAIQRKANAKIKGNKNTIIQNSSIGDQKR